MRIVITLLGFMVPFSANAAARGAEVPFTTLEAESASAGGGASLNDDAFIKVSSSEKGYVHLDGTGEYVQFNALTAANRLTLRYSIPRSSGGTLSLYVDGVHRLDFGLTSTQCYDEANADYVRRYNEVSAAVSIAAGSGVRIQKDAADTCAWYGVDLIDLESAPAALPMPANFISITDSGATASDTTDDTRAIRAAINAASALGKGVWIPYGTFRQNARITVPANVDIRGAGIWYSVLHNTVAGTTFSNDIGFGLTSGSVISDIRFTGAARARGIACILFRPSGHHDTLQNLWIQNVGCVHGWDDHHHMVARNCRVIGTYFDGLHWGDGPSYDNLAENNFFRGLGDDAIAQVNRADRGLCYRNVARFNTIVASYWGRGMTNIGGDTLTFTDNIISSLYAAGLMIATEVLTPSVSRPVRGFQFLRNTIRKCGHTSAVGATASNHAGIHVWLNQNPMQGVVIKDNLIEYGETRGIRIDNTAYGDAGGRTLFENNISRCNAGANYDNASDDIAPVLTNNDFSGCSVEAEDGALPGPDPLLIVSPNPFSRSTALRFGPSAPSAFEILNLKGEVVLRANALSGTFTWDASGAPAGIYLARSGTGKTRKTIRMFLIR